jgi:cytochrome c
VIKLGLITNALAMTTVVASMHSFADTLLGVDTTTPTEVTEIIKRYECYDCHAITELRIGPSYRMIAGRHGARKDVMVDVLAQKVLQGGAGNWGVTPMIATGKFSAISLDEARTVTRWILQLDPDG